MLKSIDVDINRVNSQICSIFQEIGEKIYNRYCDGEDAPMERAFVQEQVENIAAKKGELEVLDKKRLEIEQRYGEEIEMLTKLLPQESSNAVGNKPISNNTVATIGTCPKCGSARLEDEIFCSNCGNKY